VTRGSVRTWAAVLACATALLAGCAPHVAAPPELERDAVRARFASRLRERREQAAHAEGQIDVWIHRDGRRDPPGASARLWLEAPESFRIRAEGLVGTALDAAARGDSLVVQIPALDVRAITHDAAAAGGLGTAGSIVWNVLAAGFEPPDSAWLAATRRDSFAVVAWREGRDSLSLAIGASGLPSEARLRTHSGTEIVTRYERWQAFDRIPWPARLVIEREGDGTRATLQLQAMRLRPASATPLVRLRVPAASIEMSSRDWLKLVGRIVGDALGPGAEETAP